MTRRTVFGAAAVLALALALAGCGSSGKSGSSQSQTQNPDANKLQAAVASYDLVKGAPARFLVGLQMGDGRLVGYGTVQVRVHPQGAAGGTWTTARFLPVPGTQPPNPVPAQAALVDALHGRGVYETVAGFDQPGIWTADVRADVAGLGATTATTTFQVNTQHSAVAVGDKAPPSNNPTVANHPGVALTAVDSRAQGSNPVPDPTMHATTVAAVLAAHRPLVVVVSTPVYCQSRFCGPITDMVEGVAKRYGAQADFVHLEVWQDYEKQQLAPTATQWMLRGQGDGSEPWVFVVGSDGIVKARFDNVVSEAELVAAINRYAK